VAPTALSPSVNARMPIGASSRVSLSILLDFIDVMSGKHQITDLDCRKLNHQKRRLQLRASLRLPLTEGFDKRRSMNSVFPKSSLWKTRNRRNKLSSNHS